MERHLARGIVLSVATLVGLWVVADLLFSSSGLPGRGPETLALLGWGAMGIGLALLLSALHHVTAAAMVALVVTAAAWAGWVLDLGPLHELVWTPFTWVTVGAVAARAVILAARGLAGRSRAPGE